MSQALSNTSYNTSQNLLVLRGSQVPGVVNVKAIPSSLPTPPLPPHCLLPTLQCRLQPAPHPLTDQFKPPKISIHDQANSSMSFHRSSICFHPGGQMTSFYFSTYAYSSCIDGCVHEYPNPDINIKTFTISTAKLKTTIALFDIVLSIMIKSLIIDRKQAQSRAAARIDPDTKVTGEFSTKGSYFPT